MNLGELKTALQACDPSKAIYINFGEPTSPDEITSWRGLYSEAAITFKRAIIGDSDMRVGEFIELIDSALSTNHRGYKGGEYQFDAHTQVWIAEHGWSGNCGVGEVIDEGWCVFLQPCFQSC